MNASWDIRLTSDRYWLRRGEPGDTGQFAGRFRLGLQPPPYRAGLAGLEREPC
jgi:hypothetical protein